MSRKLARWAVYVILTLMALMIGWAKKDDPTVPYMMAAWIIGVWSGAVLENGFLTGADR